MLPLLGGALKAAPYLLGAMRLAKGNPKINWNEIRGFANSLRPSGYLNPEDLAAGAQVRSRLSGASDEVAGNRRLEALRRIRQRGVDLAPANEATLGRIGEEQVAGHERAAQGAEEYLSNIRLGNQRFEQEKAMNLLNTRLGEAGRDVARGDVRNTSFFNSLLDLTPDLIGGIDQLRGQRTAQPGWNEDPSTIGPRRYNPASGMSESTQEQAGPGY